VTAAHPSRFDLICQFCPKAEIIVDVGADHGLVAQRVGAIATERKPHRRGDAAVPWVIANGLAPFRAVDVAIIAGMGAGKIIRILQAGPRPKTLVLHPTSHSGSLRHYLAQNGWKIAKEALAPDNRSFAEVVLAVNGKEQATGLTLEFGPLLTQGEDPWWVPFLNHLAEHWNSIALATKDVAPERHRWAEERLLFLRSEIRKRPST